MAKDYNTFSDVSTGDVYTAAAHNLILENLNNHRVPPSVKVRLTSNDSGATSGAAVSWDAQDWDTDEMWTSGTDITVNTSGLYVASIQGLAQAGTSFSVFEPIVKVDGAVAIQQVAALFNPYARPAFSFTLSLTATDVVTFAPTWSASGSVDLAGAATGASAMQMSLTWIGQVS